MTVIPAFETHKTTLPDVVFAAAQPTEDFSDYVREAIDRSQDTEPATPSTVAEARSADARATDRAADRAREDHRAYEVRRDDERHRDRQRFDHDRDATPAAAPADRPLSHADERTGTSDRQTGADGNDDTKASSDTASTDAPAAKDAGKTSADASDTAAKDGPSDDATAAAAAKTAKADDKPTAKTVAAKAALTAAQLHAASKTDGAGKAVKTAHAADDNKSKVAAPKGADAAAANGQAVPAKAANAETAAKSQPAPDASAQANAKANEGATAQLLPAVAEEAANDKRPAPGKDGKHGQPVAVVKKQNAAANGPHVKADTDANAQDNGKANNQAAANQTAAATAKAAKPAPAFAGMLPTADQTFGRTAGTGDTTQASGLTPAGATGSTASTMAKMAAHKAAAGSPTPAGEQVAVRIASAVRQGVDRISVQLEPQDLGRVDIKLDVSKDGRVHATISADRHDTLDLLQRDSRTLERTLQQAGLKADSDSLNFNLRGDGQDRQQAGTNGGSGGPVVPTAFADDEPIADAALYRSVNSTSALDIRV